MLTHRCPWCGEKCGPSDARWFKQVDKCPKCKRLYELRNKRPRYEVDALIIVGISLVLIVTIEQQEFLAFLLPFFLFAIIIIAILDLLWYLRLPLQRHIEKWEQRPVKKSVAAQIQWMDTRSRGLVCPVFQAPNKEIFPAFFLDAQGELLSQGLCVVLEKIHWTGWRRCSCHIEIVLDDVPAEQYLQSGNQFYLYHRKRKIAVGTIG